MCNISLAIESVAVNPIVGIATKYCKDCDTVKPVSEFNKNKKAKSGLTTYCKECNCARKKKYRQANPEKVRECNRKYYRENIEKSRERGRKWEKANPEKVRENCRKWRKANPEKARENYLKWVKENPERVGELRRRHYLENLSKIREQTRQYAKANPAKMRDLANRRRAREANAPGESTAEQIQARFDYHGNKCIYCGCSDQPLDIEHMIPLSRGGSNWPSNLAPACRSCNARKHAKTYKEFVATIHEPASV